MISTKIVALMAAFAVVGMTSFLPSTVYADKDNGNTIEIDQERNNSIEQSIEQEQEACTNELEAEVSDDDLFDIGGDNTATADQSNLCVVTQTQAATNLAGIVDNSVNDLGVEAILAEVGLSL